MVTSRERVLLALNHKEPDRVPIDFGGMRSTGISTISYNKLLKKLGIEKKSRMYDFIQQLAYPDEEILKLFYVDIVDVSRYFLKSDNFWREWVLNDGSKCLIPKYLDIEINENSTVLLKNKEGLVLGKKPKDSLYTDHAYWVYKDFEKIPDKFEKSDLVKQMWAIPTPEWQQDIFNNESYKRFINNIKEASENTDYALILGIGCSLFERGNYLRGMENFLCDIYIGKRGVERLFDAFLEEYLKLLERVLSGVGKYIDILVFGDDLGSNQSTFFSKEKFRELFKPRYKKMYEYVHNKSKCKIFLHSCGAIYDFIPDLVEIGLDIINPVQTSASGMEPEKLKKEFGKDLTFWGGGCDTSKILPYGSPKDVKDDVEKRINIFAKGGGFIFNQVHNILADIPPENVIAMFESAYKYGFYNK
ncbi:MAG: uroporphyrinogen decarboxylase family protein [Candidatus Humimicrobiaceae bacterium]